MYIIAVHLTKKWLRKSQLASIPSTFGDEHAEKCWCYLQLRDASTSRARAPPQVLVLFKSRPLVH